MECHRRHFAMLRQGSHRVQRDVGSWNRGVDHKDKGLALLFNRLDDRPYSPQVMRAGPDRYNATKSATASVLCVVCVKAGGVSMTTISMPC